MANILYSASLILLRTTTRIIYFYVYGVNWGLTLRGIHHRDVPTRTLEK